MKGHLNSLLHGVKLVLIVSDLKHPSVWRWLLLHIAQGCLAERPAGKLPTASCLLMRVSLPLGTWLLGPQALLHELPQLAAAAVELESALHSSGTKTSKSSAGSVLVGHLNRAWEV